MTTPLITPDELGTYLNIADNINVDRAASIIQDATDACQSVINPIPDNKLFVVRRIAMRAYLAGAGQARGYQLTSGGADQAMPSPMAGVYLTAKDQADLLSTPVATVGSGDSAAFTIRTTPDAFRPVTPDAWRYPYGQRFW